MPEAGSAECVPTDERAFLPVASQDRETHLSKGNSTRRKGCNRPRTGDEASITNGAGAGGCSDGRVFRTRAKGLDRIACALWWASASASVSRCGGRGPVRISCCRPARAPSTVRSERSSSSLRQNRGEPGKHVIHDRLGNGLEALPVAGSEIEGARLVTTDHTDRPGTRIVERNREAAPARKISTRRDRQDDRCSGQFVEGCRGYDHHWPGPSLLMAGRGVEADKPDLAPLHYNSSLPTGRASSQARSASSTGAVSSHCASSSLSE